MRTWREDIQEAMEESINNNYVDTEFESEEEKKKFIEEYPEFIMERVWRDLDGILIEALQDYRRNKLKENNG